MARAPSKTLTEKDGAVPPPMFAMVESVRPEREIPISLLPPSDWRPPDMSALPSWAGAKRVGFDCETRDPEIRQLGPGCRRPGNYVVGWSFSIEDGPTHYLPFRHQGGDNLPEDAVLRYVRQQAKEFRGELVGAHLAYDMDWAETEGVHFEPSAWRDVLIAAPLIYEHEDSYSLEAVCGRLGMPGKDQGLLEEAARRVGVDPKSSLWRLPARYVGPYAERDARAPLEALRRQERELEAQDLWGVWDLESRLLPVLVRMRRRGLRFSWERLRAVEDWTLEQEGKALAMVRHETGVDIHVGDVWKPEPMAKALRAIGIELPKTSTGADSVRKDILASIEHPVARALGLARKVNKLRTTFAASIRRYAVGDRIHCTFNQLRATDDETGDEKGVKHGRLSAEDPNMQQQPSKDRDELAAPWRKIFVADDGRIFAAPDYSQQEPRWLISFAERMQLPRAREAAQRYRDNPDTDNHDMMTRLIHGDEVVSGWDAKTYKMTRRWCKDIFLGKCYNMGGAKFSRSVGLPTRFAIFWRERGRQNVYFETREQAADHLRESRGIGGVWEVAGEEAQGMLDKFDAEAPFVRMMSKAAEKRAEEQGFIRTHSGRRCRFPVRADGSRDWAHKALNRLIQGCSADQTKAAMVAMEEAGIALQLQVHDEICWSARDLDEARAGAQIMRDVIQLSVPMRVDLECGPSWGEVEAVK